MTTLLSLVCFQSLGQISSPTTDKAKNNFTIRMNNHIAKCLDDPEKMAKATTLFGHTCDKNHTVTPEEIKARAAEAEKHAFIQSNMDEYMNIYFPNQPQNSLNTTVTICDNGGFEQDFLHYTGFSGTFTHGSNSCTPVDGLFPTTFVQKPLPTLREFEIATQGADPITGLQKVKFGSKSLKINHEYSNSASQCAGLWGINKLKKTFLVTDENRDFTVWYSVALENPSNHINQQPFISIKCDLAPSYDLCYDSDFLDCDKIYNQPGCGFEIMDVLDWTCHRIKIPASEIGNIATLEIIVADCGQSNHNGYAYIDGICEECTGSALGSISLPNGIQSNQGNIEYYSCDGDKVRICGNYTLPSVCGDWKLHSLTFPGYTVENLTIDSINGTFCFDFPITSFGNQNCVDIYAEIIFKNGQILMPTQFSNSINICKDKIKKYKVSPIVSECNSNGTPEFLSDDYYYVTVNISAPNGASWSIQRKTSQYPGESGLYTITNGNGDDIITLGPFLIQEGCWDIIINFPRCNLTQKICPPPFCSGCDAFAGVEITNVKCIPGNLGGQDTWTFDIFVPGTGDYTIFGMTKSKGSIHTLPSPPMAIGQSCLAVTLRDESVNCTQNLIICPPVPCSDRDCKIEVYPGKITCTFTPNGYTYVVKLNTVPNNLCYKTPNSLVSLPIPASGEIGPFTGGTEVVISPTPCGDNPTCFKVIYLPKPNCDDPNIELSQGRIKPSTTEWSLKIVPNPFFTNEVTIKSEINVETDVLYLIYNNAGQMIQSGKFSGQEQIIPFEQASGVYLIKFKGSDGNEQNYKFLKL